MTTIAFRRFLNSLKILRSLDAHEVEGIADWVLFRDDPYMYFMRAPARDQALIYRAINRRQPEDLRLGPQHEPEGLDD